MSELDVTLKKVRQRDDLAIAELVRANHRALRGYVAALSSDLNAVDDLSQEVFLRALERLDKIDDLQNFPRFLRGIARNVVREHFRKNAIHSERYVQFVEEVYPSEESAGADLPVNDPQVAAAMRECMSKLSDKAREMLKMRYTEELPADQIGKALGLNGGAVRTSLLRIRETILKCVRSSLGRSALETGS
jgi:RNA polymerase sigma-70 factor, ECF subfamily